MAPQHLLGVLVGERLAVDEMHVHVARRGARPRDASASMTER